MDKKISDKVINRLTLYHCILQDYIACGEKIISSGQIASLLNIDDSQVRKDISILNNSGKSRIGYIVEELKVSIERTLGFSKTKKAFIIGAGNLGMALAKYDNFTNYGLNIVALFDNDKAKIGTTVNGRLILDVTKLPNLAKKNNVDTGSSLRGIEIEADVMLKGTRVDGIYTADPEKDPTATKFHDISYDEVISRGLKVMDITATAMCKQNNLPIYVFNMDVVGNLMKVMQGEEIGTFVHP